jgi:hypothetical protein
MAARNVWLFSLDVFARLHLSLDGTGFPIDAITFGCICARFLGGLEVGIGCIRLTRRNQLVLASEREQNDAPPARPISIAGPRAFPTLTFVNARFCCCDDVVPHVSRQRERVRIVGGDSVLIAPAIPKSALVTKLGLEVINRVLPIEDRVLIVFPIEQLRVAFMLHGIAATMCNSLILQSTMFQICNMEMVGSERVRNAKMPMK